MSMAKVIRPGAIIAFTVSAMAIMVLSGCTSSTESALSPSSSTAAEESTVAAISPGAATGDDLKIVEKLPPPLNTNQGADELVAENDLLLVDVFQVNELDREVRVDSRGRISLALIGAVDAKGKTIPELESEIEKRYATNYLQNPEVSVFMKESAGQRITIDGAVRKPGIYGVTSTTTLLQVIALAGGFQEIADEGKLYVYRDFEGRKLVANYDVKDIREGKNADPRIYGGDVIVSFQSGAKVAARNLRQALGLASGALSVATPF